MARTLSQSQAYIEELVEIEGHGENFLKEFGAGVLGVGKDTVHFFGTLLSEAVHGEWWDLIKDSVIAVGIGVVIALVVGFGGWIAALVVLALVALDFYSSLRSGKSLGYTLGHGLTLGGLFFLGSGLMAGEEGVEGAVAAGRAGVESVERAEIGEVTKGQKSKVKVAKIEKLTVENLLETAEDTTKSKGPVRNYEKIGDYKTCLDEFNGLRPTSKKEINTSYGEGFVGVLDDNTKIIARPGSKTGGPTLEISQSSSRKIIKIRYIK